MLYNEPIVDEELSKDDFLKSEDEEQMKMFIAEDEEGVTKVL